MDREIVFDTHAVSFTMHPAQKVSKDPILLADQPCEGNLIHQGGSAFYDAEEKIFKMWYLGNSSEYFDRVTTFYATSRDSIHWNKSTRGTIRSNNGKPHNAVADRILPSVIKDLQDPDPARRYKMVCYQLDRGYCSMVSADGLHWNDTGPKTIAPIPYVDDVVTAFWSQPDQSFVAFVKQTMPDMGRARRTLWTTMSHDFVHWSKPEPALVADRRDDYGSRVRAAQSRAVLNLPDNPNVMRTEFYGTSAYSAESCTVVFPWMLTITTNVPGSGGHEGTIEMQLGVSHDLVHWQRPFRTPTVARGNSGEWDAGMASGFSYAFDFQDEVWLYYEAYRHSHEYPGQGRRSQQQSGSPPDTGIGLAKWKKDRFVSADGPVSGATLTTVPIQFTGTRLELNANVNPQGKILVELLDLSLDRLASWPVSRPVKGDHLRHVVQFDDRTDVAALVNQPLVLRFHLYDAELFSFAFRK